MQIIWSQIFVDCSPDLFRLQAVPPNKLNWTSDFIFRVLMHGVLPILILLGIQFPEVLQNLLSWLNSQIPPDLVVRSQAVDIIILILSLIRRKTLSTISRRPRKSSFELLSLSEGH